jgi:hypothetical protein
MLIPKALTIDVPSAPAAFRGRVWEVMSRGRGPQGGLPPPEGIVILTAEVVPKLCPTQAHS